MWLFNNPPRKYLQEKYKFDPTDSWLEHVQKASVRFNSGGSGSFVSGDGLVMTNHHVGADAAQKWATDKHNYYATASSPEARAEEHKCEAIELNVLQSIEDVTERVNAAVKADMTPEKAFVARRGVMAQIEKESQDKTGLRSDVVTLYQGGQSTISTAPRNTLTSASSSPPSSGRPFTAATRTTSSILASALIALPSSAFTKTASPPRSKHFSEMEQGWRLSRRRTRLCQRSHAGTHRAGKTPLPSWTFLRDRGYPFMMQRLSRLEVMLTAYSSRSEEGTREKRTGHQNSRKAFNGRPCSSRACSKRRRARSCKTSSPPTISLIYPHGTGSGLRVLKKSALQKHRPVHLKARQVSTRSCSPSPGRWSALAEEKPKESTARLREFRDSNLQSLELELFSEEPIYDGFEIAKLTDSLTFLIGQMGYGNALVRKVLSGKAVERAAGNGRAWHPAQGQRVAERKAYREDEPRSGASTTR